jgi:hypothetical protein
MIAPKAEAAIPYPTDLREKIEIDKGVFVAVSVDIDYSDKLDKEQICYALGLLFGDILKRYEV